MKKLIAIALVLLMAAAYVPATLAAPKAVDKSAVDVIKNQNSAAGLDLPNGGNALNDTVRRSSTTASDASDVNESLSFGAKTEATKGSWTAVPYWDVELFARDESLTSAYQFDTSMNDFAIADDFYTSEDCWGTMFGVAAGNELKRFEKGETFFINYDLYETFSGGYATYFDDDIEIGLYMFAGTYAEYQSDAGCPQVASWLGLEAVDIKVVTPTDDYVYMFFVAIRDTSITSFGTILGISDYDIDYKGMKSAGTITTDDEVDLYVGGSDTDLILTDLNILCYAAMYEIEMTAGEVFVGHLESSDSIGTTLMFLDENKDVIASTGISNELFPYGYDYYDAPLPMIPVVDGTYYVVIGGFFMGDVGDVELSFLTWEEAYSGESCDLVDVEVDIDVLADARADYEDPEGKWAFWWFGDQNYGNLVLAHPGTYRITGSNPSVGVDAYDGVTVELNDATIGALWINNMWGSVRVHANGECSIEDDGVIYTTVYNYEGQYAGLYFTGDTLVVDGPQGVMLDNAALHIYTERFEAIAEGMTGSFTVALWVIGVLTPELTLGDNEEFIPDYYQICNLWFEQNRYFLQGYSVSEYEDLYRYNGSTNYYNMASDFAILTDGIGGGENPPEVLYGDATQDGRINTGDAVAVLKHCASMVILNGNALLAADMTRDGRVNTGDAVAILKYVAGQ